MLLVGYRLGCSEDVVVDRKCGSHSTLHISASIITHHRGR
ncbi:hypothetical protein MAXJ12_31994 [Mesorhizobium alhagi CCNWXJ12-2]|uniref:Uncharacterized protein n=1 Tax=Mesorhizobium alhagi CCNWXJ12-2 TaxID=1107882 RepID=H0I1R1_9HYPH|nr:hypothetical protein MAXJ12_31994 [Mesorhizobium alhagi CCNWXJ12-2]